MSFRVVVELRGIRWDDGKGEYDVRDLPTDVNVEIPRNVARECKSARDMIDYALEILTDRYSMLIDDVESARVISR